MSWFEKAKEIYQNNPDLTYDEVAAQFGKAGKTLKNRIYQERKLSSSSKDIESFDERKPIVEEVDGIYYIYNKNRSYSCEISKEDLRRLKILYCEQHLTINHVCREMEIPRRDFFLIKNAFGITHDDVPYIDEDLINDDMDELVEESIQRRKKEFFVKLQEKERESEKKELLMYRSKNYFYDKLLDGLKSELQNLAVNIPNKRVKPSSLSGKTLVLNLADMHKGKLILGSKMPSGNEYNEDIFWQRLNKIISRTKYMLENNDYDKFYIVNYGDALDDPEANTYNKQILNQYASGENQVMGYLRAMVYLINELSPDYYIGVPGNHSKGYVNWDILANQMLEFVYSMQETDIIFDCTDKASKILKIYDSDLVISHGNHISSSPTKGQLDTLNIFRMYGLNSAKTYLFQGHLHHYESTKYRRILLPSMCGGDDLAENMINTTSRPAQLLCVFTEEGLSEEHFIYLDE